MREGTSGLTLERLLTGGTGGKRARLINDGRSSQGKDEGSFQLVVDGSGETISENGGIKERHFSPRLGALDLESDTGGGGSIEDDNGVNDDPNVGADPVRRVEPRSL